MLTQDFQNIIINYALDEYPKECCGFVTENEVISCENIAKNKITNFEIDTKKYLEIVDSKKILYLYHSHCLSDENFSEIDIKTSHFLEIPLVVYSTMTKKFNYYFPEGNKYIADFKNRSFVSGSTDCWGLVSDFYQQNFGKYLPNLGVSRDLANNPNFENFTHLNNKLVLRLLPNLNISELKFGDILGFAIGNKTVNHVGVYLNKNTFIHHLMNRKPEITFLSSFFIKRLLKIWRHIDND